MTKPGEDPGSEHRARDPHEGGGPGGRIESPLGPGVSSTKPIRSFSARRHRLHVSHDVVQEKNRLTV